MSVDISENSKFTVIYVLLAGVSLLLLLLLCLLKKYFGGHTKFSCIYASVFNVDQETDKMHLFSRTKFIQNQGTHRNKLI